MKLGISMTLNHSSAEQWAQKHLEAGLSSVVFPCTFEEELCKIDAYKKACEDCGLTIAEVGVWKNILSSDKKERQQNFEFCKRQLELADYVGARCCVNIAGAKGKIWDGAYKENYAKTTYEEIVKSVQDLLDSVKPKKTFYALETMPWMHPDSPEDYLELIKDINRKSFGAHLDIINMISTPKRLLFNEQFTADTFNLLGKYIKSCHIKDVRLEQPFTVNLKEVACGEGDFNLKNYVNQIDALDEDMPVIIEHLQTEEEYFKAIEYVLNL